MQERVTLDQNFGSLPPLSSSAEALPVEGYDVMEIRKDFPILQREVHGKPLVYLDNAASAQKPRCVIDTMARTYAEDYANVHRGLHFLSNRATELYEEARRCVADFLNAETAEEIIFTRSATESINLVAASYGEEFIGPGDEIVLSILEHHANIIPWHFHRERRGAVLKWVPITDSGAFCLEAFETLLTERTKMVAVTQMSNVTGTRVPIEEVCHLAHARGIPVLVDGSQGAVHGTVDVQKLGCDFYVMTGHKLYGPTGIGVLYGKKERLKALRPFNGGGEMIRTVTCTEVTYNAPPHRFEAGTPPIVQAIGLAEALRYMERLGRDRIAAHEARLCAMAQERLSALEGVRIFGETPDKGALISFDVAGVHPHDIAVLIDQMGVAVRAGTHCAQPLLARYGRTATCRASFALYNTLEEVDVLCDSVARALAFFC